MRLGSASRQPNPHTRKVGATCHILIVENDRDLRTVVRMLLERAGHRVDEARDGAEALRLSGRNRFDLVIADMRMPVMSGGELARRLRSDPRTIGVPILMMSGDSNLDPAGTGAHAVLRKPFEVEQLLSAVHSLTGSAGGIS